MAHDGISARALGEYRFAGSIRVYTDRVSPIRAFTLPGTVFDKLCRHLRTGGIVVLEGRWDEIRSIYDRLMARKRELVVVRDAMRHEKRDWEDIYKELSSRVTVRVNGTELADIAPKVDVPFLSGFLGEPSDETSLFLAPLGNVIQTIESIKQPYPVDALGCSLLVHRNVLIPGPQEVLNLIRDGLAECKASMPARSGVDILDMGCGSGCCSFIAAHIFKDCQARIYAADHLPEAMATTALNIRMLTDMGKLKPDTVMASACGDLFSTVGDSRYDIAVFNAPWVVARARTPAETALCDENQETVTRFLTGVNRRLKPGGRVLLGYSDNSGQKAVDKVESVAASADLVVENVLKDRIKTRRSSGRWETVLVYRFKRRI